MNSAMSRRGEPSVVSRAEALLGTYWSATEHGHVINESRLELALLMYADFDISVNRIVAQPFLLKAEVNGHPRIAHRPRRRLLRSTPGAIGSVTFGKYVSPDYRSAQNVIPATETNTGAPIPLGENEITFDLYLPTGNRRWADGPVAIVGHGATSHKHNVIPVSDVAVFGIPDPEFGKSLAAHGELVPGADITVEGIRGHAAAHMAKYKVPKLVVFEAQLHRHDTGKLFKRKLGEQYWHHRTKA